MKRITSTPCNVSVGGTAVADTYQGNNAAFWSTVNTASYGSALSYIYSREVLSVRGTATNFAISLRVGQRTGKFKPRIEDFPIADRTGLHQPTLLGMAAKEKTHNLARHDVAP